MTEEVTPRKKRRKSSLGGIIILAAFGLMIFAIGGGFNPKPSPTVSSIETSRTQ